MYFVVLYPIQPSLIYSLSIPFYFSLLTLVVASMSLYEPSVLVVMLLSHNALLADGHVCAVDIVAG